MQEQPQRVQEQPEQWRQEQPEQWRRVQGQPEEGQQCRVRRFMDGEEAVILVQRGTYVQTVPFWNGDQIAMQSFRPAVEDVLVWEPEGFLRIRSSLPGDRRAYLYQFA